MSVNRERAHLIVLPEDEANEKIANGFLLDARVRHRQLQVLPLARGWPKVRDKFVNNHTDTMRQYTERRFVLLMDCAENQFERWNHPLLQHNRHELERLRKDVHPSLFV